MYILRLLCFVPNHYLLFNQLVMASYFSLRPIWDFPCEDHWSLSLRFPLISIARLCHLLIYLRSLLHSSAILDPISSLVALPTIFRDGNFHALLVELNDWCAVYMYGSWTPYSLLPEWLLSFYWVDRLFVISESHTEWLVVLGWLFDKLVDDMSVDSCWVATAKSSLACFNIILHLFCLL